MRIAFLGTPEFALPSLQMLIDEGHTLCVFTQPDKPQGRHAKLTPPPVKVLAQQYDIPVYQPARMKSAEGMKYLRLFAPELMVTAAFGQILSAENLAAPKYGCVNVHGSLLPKYRGAAPIQWAIINGEKQTGITTMMTDVGLDSGDILLQEAIDILPDETAGELYVRMAELGARVLKETIRRIEERSLPREPQNCALCSHCCILKKEHGKIDFSWLRQCVHDRIRGVNPWPGAFAIRNGVPIKFWRSRIPAHMENPPGIKTGECFGDAKTGLFIACADGPIEILEVQMPGGKRMQAKACMAGRSLCGECLI